MPDTELPLIVIPDTHGYLREVEALLAKLDKLGYLKGRRLAFLGDYVDRGPEPSRLLDLFIELKTQGHIFIAGNHDYLLAKVVSDTGCRDNWIADWHTYEDRVVEAYDMLRPMDPDFDSWKYTADELRERMPEKQRRFLADLPMVHETKRLILVHAGLNLEQDFDEQMAMLHNRGFDPFDRPNQLFSPWLAASTDNPSAKCLVTGHVSCSPPFIALSRIMLHGGVDYGRGLCAWVEDTNEVVKVGRLTLPSAY